MLLGKDHEANGPCRRLVILAWEIGNKRPTASSGANGLPLGNYEKYLPLLLPRRSIISAPGMIDLRTGVGLSPKSFDPYRAGVRIRRIADMQFIGTLINGKKVICKRRQRKSHVVSVPGTQWAPSTLSSAAVNRVNRRNWPTVRACLHNLDRRKASLALDVSVYARSHSFGVEMAEPFYPQEIGDALLSRDGPSALGQTTGSPSRMSRLGEG
ncbi:hypothetical protein LZ31DRAFT_561100 [Colletotrichum somersetense]|nr:hypothetical protein LZ31DRAFT_561100 [Colletotrichum somersetense]